MQALIGSAIAVVVGALVAWAGSAGSTSVDVPVLGAVPLFALCALVAYAVQWIVFVPSFLAHTEHFFDLTGSLTYLGLMVLVLVVTDADPRAWLLAAMVGIWAARLGSFLFLRVRTDGSDGRFDEMKYSFTAFLQTWTLQGLWVFLTLSCALAAMTSATPVPIGFFGIVGALLWAIGFAIETVSDAQKRTFRADSANAGRFITTGLWAWSRHPNYFGEILLWIGVAMVAAEALSGWQWVTLISPLFVYLLLSRISGVPLLESRAKKRWGDDPAYRAYRAATPVLMLRPPRSAQ